MNSDWIREALAVFHKEWLSEARSRHGLFTSLLFSFLAVVAVSFASFGEKPTPITASGMLSVVLMFSAVVSLPRSFLVEDEQGTFDLIRLAADPTALFFGKWLYNAVQALLSAGVLALLFVVLTGVEVRNAPMLAVGIGVMALALAGGVSVCGALVMGASNRWLLGTAAALPVLLPQIFMGMSALSSALGQRAGSSGWMGIVGLTGWAVALCSVGPLLAAAAWKTDE